MKIRFALGVVLVACSGAPTPVFDNGLPPVADAAIPTPTSPALVVVRMPRDLDGDASEPESGSSDAASDAIEDSSTGIDAGADGADATEDVVDSAPPPYDANRDACDGCPF